MKLFVDGIIFARQRHGGVSRVWQEFLKRLPDHGVDVQLLLPRRFQNAALSKMLEDRQRYQVIRDHFSWPLRVFERGLVRSTLVRRHLDASVRVFQSTYFSTVYGTPIPKVVMLYDMILEKFDTGSPQKWVEWGIAIKRAALLNADHIVAISQSTKKDLLEIYPAISPDKVTVIPLAAELAPRESRLSFPAVIRRHALDLGAGSYLLYVGARRGYKNHQLLVDLLRHRRGFRNLRVLCVGGEAHEPDVSALRALGLDRNVLFVNAVTDEELSVLYRNALALIYPSRYEGFGLPVLEAMAEGCPVVCSEAASLPEVGGGAALYFDPESVDSLESALARLLSATRDEIVQRGLQNAARFSWDRSTRALVDLYRGLADVA
jgi:mannosyltransferase